MALKITDIDETQAPLMDHLLELRNLATVAALIVDCALQRKESRGLHYTLDYLETDEKGIYAAGDRSGCRTQGSP